MPSGNVALSSVAGRQVREPLAKSIVEIHTKLWDGSLQTWFMQSVQAAELSRNGQGHVGAHAPAELSVAARDREPRPQFGYTIVRSMMRRSSGR